MDAKIIEIIEYIINNGKTIKETSEHFNLSESSIKKYIAKLKNSEDNNDIKLYNRLKKQLDENEKKGKIVGGQKSKITEKTYTVQQTEEMAIKIIVEDLTLAEASKKFNIPKSTLYEFLKTNIKNKEIQKDIELLFECHLVLKNIGSIRNKEQLKLNDLYEKYNSSIKCIDRLGIKYKNFNNTKKLSFNYDTISLIANLAYKYRLNYKDIQIMLGIDDSSLSQFIVNVKYNKNDAIKKYFSNIDVNAQNCNLEGIKKAKIELKQLVDETRMVRTLSKKMESDSNYKHTDEEKIFIISYRLKYSLTRDQISDLFGVDRKKVYSWEQKLNDNNLKSDIDDLSKYNQRRQSKF